MQSYVIVDRVRKINIQKTEVRIKKESGNKRGSVS